MRYVDKIGFSQAINTSNKNNKRKKNEGNSPPASLKLADLLGRVPIPVPVPVATPNA